MQLQVQLSPHVARRPIALAGGAYEKGTAREAFDFQEPYLRAVFGFLGLTDVSFIHVESQNIGPDAAKEGMAEARRKLNALAVVPLAA